MSRVYDIIVWGATGFTGKLICRHFVNHNDEKLKIAVGGRNKQKLENQKESEQYPSDWGIVVGNSADLSSTKEVTKLAKVVLCSAGPFLAYSKLVVEACVSTATHYCDITGETDFYKISLDKFEKKTIEDGTSIVHCCGYDSLPCDVGCYLVGSQLVKQGNTKGDIQAVLTHAKGGFSGGTIATLFQALDTTSAPPSLFQLNPPGQASGADTDQMGIRYDNDVKGWTGFSIMSTVNNRVSRRTAAVEGFSGFTISESMLFGSAFKAIGVTVAIFLFLIIAYFKMLRALLMKFLPSPGAGPTPKEQKNWICQVLCNWPR
eukprot:TRINITY_DN2405_c0_g1_i1.p1 TRINITY_DN2405_c0_g1~~TRINITY_DN2405_c0_g1_i1.p1  ORF type:complete len:340 (-),score=83.76 TRINITY_DN2405_c0_g1_i1:292-1245(-)